VAAGCGGEDADQSPQPPPEANLEDFPSAAGKTMADLRKPLGDGGPVLSLSVSQLQTGRNRVAFGLYELSRKQISDAPAVIYVAPVNGGRAIGPIKARYESLAVKPQFQSQTVRSDPDAARSVYVADVRFPEPGRYEVLGMARLDGRLVGATQAGAPLQVVDEDPVPDVGDRAPRVHTPTETDVGGDLAQIDTRIPPSSLHDVDFADVLGTKPVVIVFGTPQLCASRVCGPVVDVAEQVKAERGDEAAFVHMEIFKDNVVDRGYRPQVAAWGLPTEPWLFTVDRRGRIAARLEGAFSVRELDQAVDRAVG